MKLNISDKGKSYAIETKEPVLLGKKIGEKINGKELAKIKKELEDYEFVISGASDNAGFPALSFVEGGGRKRVLLSYGKGMREKKPKGLKKRKTVHGNVIDNLIVQINLKVEKEGKIGLAKIFGKEEEEKKEEKKEKKEGKEEKGKIEEKTERKEEKAKEEEKKEGEGKEGGEEEKTEKKEEEKGSKEKGEKREEARKRKN